MEPYIDRLRVAEAAARAAGEAIGRAHGSRKFNTDTKAHQLDFVTNVDKDAERIIVEVIRSHFPDDSIVGEEGTRVEGGEYAWHIDPIDGTSNFSRHYPLFCTSIGVMRTDTPVVGCIYQPISGELFSAYQGGGVTLNGEPIPKSAPEGAILVETSVTARLHAQIMEQIKAQRNAFGRIGGSSAMALAGVAAKRINAFITTGWNSWDYVAGWMLIEESGGVLAGVDRSKGGASLPAIAASSVELYEQLRSLNALN